MNQFLKAIDFAKVSLAGKRRYSGEEFADHCIKTAKILESFGIDDPDTLSAAVLHHSLSDGAATLEDIRKEFGGEMAEMIKNVESLRVIKLPEVTKEEFMESLRKMFLVLAKDLRVVLVKLADIYDNLHTLKFLPEEKKIMVAKETLEIFAPLTERLGMGELKGKMQDLAFEQLYPKEYLETKKLRKIGAEKLNKMLLKIKSEIARALEEEGIKFRIESRSKHLYSLYQKLKRPEINFDISKVYDVIAFRIILETEEDCYRTLGLVHKLWRPLPDYVRDYIANPKPNGYKSIHTTVFGSGGRYFEIQIRTEQMHQDAEFGVAAHWNYAEAKNRGATDEQLSKQPIEVSAKLSWVKQLSSWQDEIVDNEEFLKSVKTDFFGSRIFVFTPKGDVKDLPTGSTPVDFAYSIHTDLGRLAMGAKVNGKLVSLDTPLKNSDVCEIILSKDRNKKPNRDWLKFVVTSSAKSKIKKAHAEG